MKAAELRQSILQAAVQGKLVPQNPHDEPASGLLKQIQREKARLVKEGKIKKNKPFPPIAEDEIPYGLPEGWAWCRLDEVILDVFTGPFGSMLHKTDYVEDGIPLVNPMNMIDRKIVPSKKMLVSNETKRRLSSYALSTGDIVIARRGELGRCALVTEKENGWICGTGSFFLKLPPIFNAAYFLILFCSYQTRQQLSQSSVGATMNNLNHRIIKHVYLSIPPLNEQYRIVAKVDELMLLCDKLEAEEKKLDALEVHFIEYLPKAILQAAVQGKLVPQNSHDEPASELLKRIQQEKAQLVKGEKLKKEKPLPPISEDEIPYDLPEGWEWCRLGEICNYGSTQNIQPDDIPVDAWILELEDIEKDTGKLLCKRSKLQRKPMSTKHCFLPNDILYSKLRPYLNKVLIAEDYGYCTSEILPLSFYGGLNVRYILNFLRSPLFVDYTNECSYGVKMPRLGTNDGKTALVPLPPAEEQQRIVTKIDELIPFCDELKSAYTTPVKLKQVKTEIIPFPTLQKEPKTLLAARGDVGQLSNEAMQAINDLFAEDEE